MDLKKNFRGERQCGVMVTGTDSVGDRPGMESQQRGSPAVCPQANNLTSLSFRSLTWKEVINYLPHRPLSLGTHMAALAESHNHGCPASVLEQQRRTHQKLVYLSLRIHRNPCHCHHGPATVPNIRGDPPKCTQTLAVPSPQSWE